MTGKEYLELRKNGVSDKEIAKIIDEDNYYNGSLSKFIGKSVPHIMTSIDADIIQIKKAKKTIRFIESKHLTEPIKFQQEDTFKKWLPDIAEDYNKYNKKGKKIEIFIVRGNRINTNNILKDINNPQYERLKVFDCVNLQSSILNSRRKIIDFLALKTNGIQNNYKI